MENNKETIRELNLKIVELIDEYKDKLDACEIGNCLIVNGSGLLLTCAPNELLGVKVILASVRNGISFYEDMQP